MSAPADNTYAMKFKTPEERQALCRDYVAHIENGYSKESFVPCDMQTLRRYMDDFPEDFDTDRMKQAERGGRQFWEGAGIAGTMGKIEGFNASSWKFNMANRFGWAERREDTVKVQKKDAVQALGTAMLGESEDDPSPHAGPEAEGA